MSKDSVRALREAALLASLPEPQGVSALSGNDQPRGFTPGPWCASNAHTGPTFWRVDPLSTEYLNDGWVIANEIHGPDGEANARLISAAPDLHYVATLVTELADVLGDKNAVVVLARAALAKALGL